ncbi:TPA: hypothetical protein ACH3X1_013546 [Trebouxia sp. C0004]
MPFSGGAVPVLEVGTIIEALRQHLGGTHDYALHCPRAAPSAGVVACTYHQWFRPFSRHRRYCQLPVSGRRMQRFLQFRLGSHQPPIVLGRFAGAQHVARANRVCAHCGSVAVADELHVVFECLALQAVRQRYAPLFSADTTTMRSFFAQQDHMQVFKRITALLLSKALWDVVRGEEDDKAKSEQALGLVQLYVSDYYLSTADGIKTAKGLWDKLENTFKATSNARRLTLRQELNNLKKEPSEQMTQYIARAKELASNLDAIGHKVEDSEVALPRLAGLPQEYSPDFAPLVTTPLRYLCKSCTVLLNTQALSTPFVFTN